MTNPNLGACLRWYRCRASLRIEEAAALAGISCSRLIAMEVGCCQDLMAFAKVAEAYSTTVPEIVERARRIAWDTLDLPEPGGDPPRSA